MARKKPSTAVEVVTVNVLYEDGTQSSNRRVPGVELNGFDDEELIRQAVEAQDSKIAELSGQSRGPIKSITRIGAR